MITVFFSVFYWTNSRLSGTANVALAVTMVIGWIINHSRDDQEVGVAHEVKSPEKLASIFPDDNGAVLVR